MHLSHMYILENCDRLQILVLGAPEQKSNIHNVENKSVFPCLSPFAFRCVRSCAFEYFLYLSFWFLFRFACAVCCLFNGAEYIFSTYSFLFCFCATSKFQWYDMNSPLFFVRYSLFVPRFFPHIVHSGGASVSTVNFRWVYSVCQMCVRIRYFVFSLSRAVLRRNAHLIWQHCCGHWTVTSRVQFSRMNWIIVRHSGDEVMRHKPIYLLSVCVRSILYSAESRK